MIIKLIDNRTLSTTLNKVLSLREYSSYATISTFANSSVVETSLI